MAFDTSGALGAGYSPAEIVTFLQDNPAEAGGFDFKGALGAGYSAAEIIDHLNPKAGVNVQGIPVLAPIQRGVGHLWQEGANLADDMGFKETGAAIRSRITQAPLSAETSGHKLAEDLHAGHYMSALGNVPSAALEQLIPVAAGAGASILSGGSIPATLAAGAGIGAVAQGDAIARQRAANNGRTEPTATDLALGLAGGAATGAVGTVGLGGVGRGARAALSATVRHAAADAAQPEMTALAGSVGTDAGVQHASAADMGASALTGLATRGAMGAPDIVRGAIETVQARSPEGRKAAAEGRWEALSDVEQAETAHRAAAADIIAQVKRDAVGGPVSDAVAAGTAADLVAGRVTRLASSLDKQGVLAGDGMETIGRAVKAASDPGAALMEEHFSDIRSLGLDAETTGQINEGLKLVNSLSTPDYTVAPQGPVEGVMRGMGSSAAGAALGSLLGPQGTIAGAITGHMFRPAGAGAFGVLGRTIDRMVGTAPVSQVQQARNAASMMEAAGVTVPDTVAGLVEATGKARSVIEAQARLMGMRDAEDRATAQTWKVDYADAAHMNRQFDAKQAAEARFVYQDALAIDRQRTQAESFERAQEVGDAQAIDKQRNVERAQEIGDAQAMDRQKTRAEHFGRAQELGDASAIDRQRNLERAQQIGDAQVMDRQRTQTENLERAQEVGDARAIDAARTRGINLNEREGGKVAIMALRRAEAAEALKQGSQGVAAAPKDARGPLSPEAIATARATSRAPIPRLSDPLPGVDGLNPEALRQGELLPEWQYGLGEALKQALHTAGMPRNVNTAKEVRTAVAGLQERGWFGDRFADALVGHSGRVTRGLYNLLRNEMLMAHGIDMRTLEAQEGAQ